MKWIISAGKDIVVDTNQLLARLDYIQHVTEAEVTNWRFLPIKGAKSKFLACSSKEGLDGTFITAHIDEVLLLSSFGIVANSKFVIANTCIWEKLSDKEVLNRLRRQNIEVELWFAKQELSLQGRYVLRQSTLLSNIGHFGFQTSVSERKLFANRRKGFVNAVHESFDRVTPVILPKDYGGIL